MTRLFDELIHSKIETTFEYSPFSTRHLLPAPCQVKYNKMEQQDHPTELGFCRKLLKHSSQGLITSKCREGIVRKPHEYQLESHRARTSGPCSCRCQHLRRNLGRHHEAALPHKDADVGWPEIVMYGDEISDAALFSIGFRNDGNMMPTHTLWFER